MKGDVDNIERATIANEDFRRTLDTGQHLQLVQMTLPPGCDIGEELHEDRDHEQVSRAPHGLAMSGGHGDLLIFRIEEGEGEIRIDGVANRVEE